MTDQSADPANLPAPAASPDDATPPAAPRKRRRWLRVVLLGGATLLVLLVLLVLLLPTLISTGWGRGLAVGQVNHLIAGRLEVADWSLGWFSGTSLGGVKLYDADGELILEVDQLQSDLTLWNAARGHLALGDTKVVYNLTRFELWPDGGNNYLAALSPPAGPAPQPGPSPEPMPEPQPEPQPAPQEPAEAFELPDLTGVITATGRGKVFKLTDAEVAAGPGQRRRVPDLELPERTSKIDLSNPAQNVGVDVQLALKRPEGAEGNVTINGTADLFDDARRLDLAGLTADGKLAFVQLDLGLLGAFLPPDVLDLAGMLDGEIVAQGGADAFTVKGTPVIRNLAVAGTALGGDRVALDEVRLPVDVQRQGDTLTVAALGVASALVNVDTVGSVSLAALDNLAAGQPPGVADGGALELTVAVADLPGLTGQLRNTLGLQESVAVESGGLTSVTSLAFVENAVTVATTLDTEAIAGTNAGQPVALDPIHLNASAAYKPGESKIFAAVSDVAADFTSKFATLHVEAPQLAQLSLTADTDLDVLRRQLAGFVDLGETQLAGTLSVALQSTGDAADESTPLKIALTKLAARGLNVTTAAAEDGTPAKPLQLPVLDMTASADLFLKDLAPAALQNLKLDLTAGESESVNKIVVALTGKTLDLETMAATDMRLATFGINDLPWLVGKLPAELPGGGDGRRAVLGRRGELRPG